MIIKWLDIVRDIANDVCKPCVIFAGNSQIVGDAAVVATTLNGTAITIIAVTLALVNFVALAAVGIRWHRQRKRRAQKLGRKAIVNGHSNSAFHAEGGTIKSFQSLAAKFAPPDEDDDDEDDDDDDTISITSLTSSIS